MAENAKSQKGQTQKKYALLFDANAILGDKWASDKSRILDFKKRFDNEQRISIKLIVFKPVFDEWRKRFIDTVKGKITRYSGLAQEINDLLDTNLAPAPSQSISDRADAYISKLGLEVIEPDLSHFDVADLFLRANAQQPPFKPPKDEGFKDAVIATAMLAYIYANPDFEHIMITGDQAMSAYLVEKNTASSKARMAANIEEAESILKLELNTLNGNLAKQAHDRFYRGATDDIFSSLQVGSLTVGAYNQEYPTIGASTYSFPSWTPPASDILSRLAQPSAFPPTDALWRQKNLSFRVPDTVFAKVSGNRLFWQSSVTITAAYELSSVIAINVVGNIEHEVTYDIIWSTERKGDDHFAEPRLEGKITKTNDQSVFHPGTAIFPAIGNNGQFVVGNNTAGALHHSNNSVQPSFTVAPYVSSSLHTDMVIPSTPNPIVISEPGGIQLGVRTRDPRRFGL